MKLNDNVGKFNFKDMMPLTIFYVEKISSHSGSSIFNISGPHELNTVEVSYKPMRRSDIPSANKTSIAYLSVKTVNKSFDIHENSPIVAFTEYKEACDFVKKILDSKET